MGNSMNPARARGAQTAGRIRNMRVVGFYAPILGSGFGNYQEVSQ